MNSFTNDLNFSRIAKLWSLLFVLGLYSNLNAQTLPVAQAQNINVYVDASGNASIVPADVDNGSFDPDGDASFTLLSVSPNTFDCSDVGAPVSVTLTVQDVDGSHQASSDVTVLDTLAPVRTLNNFTLVLDGSGNGTLLTTDVSSGVSDNCSVSPVIALGQTAFDCSDIGAQSVSVSVSDGTNSRGGSVTVTVEDNSAPSVTRNDITIYLDGSGNASISNGDITSGVGDNCTGSPSISLGQTAFTGIHLGPNVISCNVSDGNGNTNAGSVTVTVEDTMAPVRTLNNHTLYLDASGNATLSSGDVASSVSDNSGSVPTITLGQTSFDCTDAASSPMTVSVTVSDGTNSRGGSVQVTVLDTVAPTFNTTAATINLSTVTGQATLAQGDVINTIADACDGSPMVNVSKTLFDCGDIGGNTVTVTVTDTYGNNRSRDVSVTVTHTPVVNADFEIVRDTACVVTVYNTSSNYNHLTWNWGDGSSTHTRAVDTVRHTYSDIDDFIITLTAYDTCDYTSQHIDTVRIWPYLHNNTRDTSCTNEPYSVIDADCISIALIEWRKDGSVYYDERPEQQSQGSVCAAGNGDGSRNTQFRSNAGIALNPVNGNIVVADKFNHRVMSWSCGATSGTRIAGAVSHSGNPHPGSKNDQLRFPQDVWVDGSGNTYIADMGNDRIMKYAPGASSGTRVAGGGTGVGSLRSPTGVVVASNGDIYVADQGNHRIVRYTSTDTTVVAGVSGVKGSGLTHLNKPWDIILDGTDMLIAEYANHRVLRWPIGASSGTVIAGGNGYGRSDRHLAGPKGISINRYDELFVVDYHNDRIMRWEAGASQGVNLAGNNGTGNGLDQVLYPEGLIVDDMGRMWISDTRNHRVMKWDVNPVALTDSTIGTGNYTVTLELEDGRNVTVDSTIYFLQDTYTLAGFTFTTNGLDLDVTNTSDDDTTWTWSWGNGDSAFVKHPGTYTYPQPGTYEVCLTVTDTCSNSDTICQLVTVTAPTASLAAGPQAQVCDESLLTVSGPSSANVLRVEYYKDGTLMTQGSTGIDTVGITVAGGNGGGSALNKFKNARRVHVDQLGNIYVTEKDNNRVTLWAPGATSGVIVAGGSRGSGSDQLSWPMGITMDANGDLIIADTYNNRVQKVSIGNLTWTTVAGGSSGSGLGQLNRPSGVAVDGSGRLYVADENNHRVVRYSSTDTVVVAGTGSAGSDLNQLHKPSDIKIAGGYFYVADRENHRVMRWPLTATSGDNGDVVAGGNGYGSGADELKHPESIGVDASGAVYISDYGNNRLQIWLPGDSVGSTRVGGVSVGRGDSAWQVSNPEGLFIAGDGSMYCVDRGNNRVQRYASQGSASQFSRMTDGTGTYHAVVYYTDGTSHTTNTVNVTVLSANAGAWTHSTTGLQLNVLGASPVGTSYIWYFGDGNSSSSGLPTHTYAADGTYTVCLVASDACGNTDSSCVDVTVATPPPPSIAGDAAENSSNTREDIDLGAGSLGAISWDVYPNPTAGLVNLHASQKGATVELMDLRGQVIATWTMDERNMQIDLSDKAQGTYMIRMILERDVHVERIILNR